MPARQPMPEADRRPDPGRVAALHAYMEMWRKRLRYRDFPANLVTLGDPDRSISQEAAASLLGCSLEYYRILERGNKVGKRYPPEFLDLVAERLLGGLPERRQMLYMLALGHPPAPPPADETGDDPDRVWVADAQALPAYLADAASYVKHANPAMLGWFDWLRPGMNVYRWVLTDPHAQQVLVDWETVWAPRTVRQLRTAAARQLDNQHLVDLREEILQQCPLARALWDTSDVYPHPDKDIRRVRPATGEVVTIKFSVWEPLSSPGTRLVVFLPQDAPPPVAGRPVTLPPAASAA
jgi:transcription regulator MmyB-like protein